MVELIELSWYVNQGFLDMPVGTCAHERVHCTHCGEDGTLVDTRMGGQHPECAGVRICDDLDCCDQGNDDIEDDVWCSDDVVPAVVVLSDRTLTRNLCRSCREALYTRPFVCLPCLLVMASEADLVTHQYTTHPLD